MRVYIFLYKLPLRETPTPVSITTLQRMLLYITLLLSMAIVLF